MEYIYAISGKIFVILKGIIRLSNLALWLTQEGMGLIPSLNGQYKMKPESERTFKQLCRSRRRELL